MRERRWLRYGVSGLAAVFLAFGTVIAQEPTEAGHQLPEDYEVPEAREEPDIDVEAGYRYLDETVVSNALQGILSRPEFVRLRLEPEEPEDAELPGWLQALFDWLDSWLGPRDDGGQAPEDSWFPGLGALNLVVYVAAAATLAFLVVFILRTVAGSVRAKKLGGSVRRETPIFRAGRAPGEVDPGEYWQRALAFGNASDFRRAIREMLLASMSTIERRGLIRFRRGLTNRDYFYAARGASRESFFFIAQAFELVYFGRREATSDTYRACKQAFESAFLQEPVA